MTLRIIKALVLLLSSVAAATALAQSANPVEVFTTAKFVITVTPQCDSGDANCDRVAYHGVRKSDGAVLNLQGKALRDICAQDTCPVLSYWFKNGNASYMLDRVKNEFSIIIADKTVASERGSWSSAAPATRNVQSAQTAAVRYFDSPQFAVKITLLCSADDNTCESALYEGKRKSDGASVALTGKAVRIQCQQANCPVDYYAFVNDSNGLVYNLNVAGSLLIVRSHDKVMLAEKGRWLATAGPE